MADNTTLNAGSGGDVYGSDDISSVKYQRVKLIHGVDGTNDGDVATTNPLPVRRPLVYGSKTTITWSGAPGGTGLATGTGARESTVIDNTSTKYRNFRIRVQTKGKASGTAYLDFYVYAALGDTTYTDGATGTDATFTAANRLNSRYLGSVKMNTTSAVQAEFMLADAFPDAPDKWGLIGINNSGAGLSDTSGDHVIEYEGIY